jgi:hypothetical protein
LSVEERDALAAPLTKKFTKKDLEVNVSGEANYTTQSERLFAQRWTNEFGWLLPAKAQDRFYSSKVFR